MLMFVDSVFSMPRTIPIYPLDSNDFNSCRNQEPAIADEPRSVYLPSVTVAEPLLQWLMTSGFRAGHSYSASAILRSAIPQPFSNSHPSQAEGENHGYRQIGQYEAL